MKKILFTVTLLLSCVLLLSGCVLTVHNDLEDDNTLEENFATDFNGKLVPAYENVDVSTLDPKLFTLNDIGRMTYTDAAVKTLCGIDVSNHNGEIDWNTVAEDGVDFVMLRIGYRGYGSKGLIGIDDSFYVNYDNAKKAGLKIGVYFYSQAVNEEEAREEAHFVLDTLQERKLDYPVAYDWEYVDYDEARTDLMTGEQITKCARAFCDEIRKSGNDAIIYFNRAVGYSEYDLSKLTDCDFWLAEYVNSPSFHYKYSIWQYSCDGQVNGINGKVDMNISVVDYSEEKTAYG